MHVAIYARVWTERQGREQTIESQLTLLRAWVEQQGHALAAEHVYTDEGWCSSIPSSRAANGSCWRSKMAEPPRL